MSEGTSAQGTYISKGNGLSPETFTEIAEVVSIAGPNETSETLDFTHLRSTGGYREKKQSFKDAGEVALTLNFIPDNATQNHITGLRAEYQVGGVKNYKITYPDTSYVIFAAYVSAIGQTANVGEKLALTVTLTVTGATSWVQI
jgi:hypothetical protein